MKTSVPRLAIKQGFSAAYFLKTTRFFLLTILMVSFLLSCKKQDAGQLATSADESSMEPAFCKKKKNVNKPYVCPASISIKTEGRKNTGKLVARLTDRIPYMINVDGTSDFSKPNGNGEWKSKDKYSSTNVVLNYQDNSGDIVCSCAYDNNGDLVVIDVVADFIIFFNPISQLREVYVSFSINGLPANVVSFDIDRSNSATGSFTNIVNLQYTGDSDYGYNDLSPILDGNGNIATNNYYRIAAKDANGAVVGYSEVKVALPQ